MKSSLISFLIFFVLAATVWAQDSSTAKTPKVVIENLEHNFGQVKEGRKISHTFLVKNEGTADLQIEDVAPT